VQDNKQYINYAYFKPIPTYNAKIWNPTKWNKIKILTMVMQFFVSIEEKQEKPQSETELTEVLELRIC
jgi:hypothetical protein